MAKTKDDVLRQVRALLDKADSTEFEAEADIFRQKADAMMTAWAIEEFELEQAGLNEVRVKPEVRTFTYPDIDNYEIKNAIVSLFSSLVRHCRCKMGFYGWREPKVVGYQGDLDYLDMLFTSVRMQMSNEMSPKPDPTKSEGENLAIFKEAGFKWEQIHQIMNPGVPWERRHGVRYTNVYKKFCEETGRPRQTTSAVGSYREQFIDAYVQRIRDRLWEMEEARESQVRGKEIVLADRNSALDEFLWEHFPNLKPHAPDCDCDKCHRCQDPKCQRPNCKAARMPVKRGQFRTIRDNPQAARMGTAAANRADLGGVKVQGKNKEIQ